jgi:hypothetical protein
LVRTADEAELDAGVWTSLWPEAPYALTDALLESVFEQGCWSVDAPLSVRLVQVARAYRVGEAADFATIFRRLDAVRLEPEDWAMALSEPAPAPYCEAFGR